MSGSEQPPLPENERVLKIRRLSHEFSNQMCVVLSYSELLKDRLDQANATMYATHVHSAAQQCSKLLDELLTLALPGKETEPGPAPAVKRPAATPAKKLRILAAEDEEVLRAMLTEMLRSNGHTVTAITNGHEALEAYRANPSDFDVVILDMHMPKLDGKDVFQAMQQINPSVKAIILTGSAYNPEIDALFQKGLYGYLHKPYSKQQLDEMLSRALES